MKFAKYKPCSRLESENLLRIKDNMEECIFSPDEYILSTGEEAFVYYIIKSGSAVVLKKMLTYEPELVEVLGECDGFGEDALVNDTKQSVTIRSLDELPVWKISRTDFDNNIKSSFLHEGLS